MEKTTRRLPIVERDEWLLPAEQELNRRYERYTDKINAIEQAAGSIVDYANGYRYFGLMISHNVSQISSTRSSSDEEPKANGSSPNASLGLYLKVNTSSGSYKRAALS